MKIDRRGFLAASSSALVLSRAQLASAADEQRSEMSAPLEFGGQIDGREVTVYTTADKTDHRLSATDKLTFKHMGQPLETQICVFVDPGDIGGAAAFAGTTCSPALPTGATYITQNACESAVCP